MAAFTPKTIKFVHGGLNLNRPVNLLPEGALRYAKNLRSYQQGRIQARPGLVKLSNTGTDNIHSFRRLNDFHPESSNSYARIIGASTKLYEGQDTFSLVESNYSGNPLSLIPFQPDQSPAPWMYIGDSNKMRKIASGGTIYDVGISAPTSAPGAAANGAGNLTGDYYYRVRARSSVTGAKSNPGPPIRNALTLTSNKVQLTMPTHSDPQVDLFDVFRYGGTVTEWRKVGTAGESATFDDDLADTDVIGRESLSFNYHKPFPTLDMPTSGSCNVSGYSVTKTGGGDFNVAWPAGTEIIIDGKSCTLYAPPTSTSSLEINENLGSLTGKTWRVDDARLDGQPLPYLWGPFGGGIQGAVLFGCGDLNRPGWVYWTNGNDPDSTALANSLEVTSPSEPMMNGVWYDGRSYCWSSERFFALYPSLSATNQFYAQVVPSGKGLVAPWMFCAGPKIWYGSKDGIYETTGGDPVSITDDELYPLFPHDTQPAVEVNGIKPPDFSAPHKDKLRLTYANGYLYFDFRDTSGNLRTLVYNTKIRHWESLDVYNPQSSTVNTLVHHLEEGPGTYPLLALIGNYVYNQTGVSDDGNAIPCDGRIGYLDFGEQRGDKLIGDLVLDVDPAGAQIDLAAEKDESTTTIATAALTGSSQTRTLVDVNNGLGALVRNLSLKFTWSSSVSTPKLYEAIVSLVPRVEQTKYRATDWTNDGSAGAKYLKLVIIRADTGGVDKTVDVEGDGGTVIDTLTINHNGELTKVYALTPAVTHEMRLVPKDADSWRLLYAVWGYDPYPEDAAIIEDFSNLGRPGTKYFRGFLLEANTAGQNVSFQVQKDGGAVVVTPTANHNGRLEIAYAFATAFQSNEVRLVPLAAWQKFNVRWIFDEHPPLAAIISPWSHAGHAGPKYVRAVRFRSDTENVSRIVTVQRDGGTQAAQITVQNNGQIRKVYPFSAPFIAHTLRLVPNGAWRLFDEEPEWIFDPWPELSTIVTPWSDAGFPGAKYVRAALIDGDTEGGSVTLNVEKDHATAAATITGVNHAGRGRQPYEFPPFIAHLLRVKPQGNIRLWPETGLIWIFDKYPELTSAPTEWTNLGYAGSKFVQGIRFRGDTGAQPVTINVVSDDGGTETTFSVNHDGVATTPFSWAPFIANDVRLEPQGDVRIFPETEWVWEPSPDLAKIWKTQPTTHDLPGYQHLRWAQIAHMATANITLTVGKDGAAQSPITIAHGSGAYRKSLVEFPPMKGKFWDYELSSLAGFRLFKKDCEVLVKPWGDSGPYRVVRPFGDIHRADGARI